MASKQFSFLSSDQALTNDLRKVISLALQLSVILLGLACWIGVIQWWAYGYRFPDPDFWSSFGSAVGGIAGAVVGGLGAVFGILIASLGLKTAQQNLDRENYTLVRDSVESAVAPFVAVGLQFTQLINSFSTGAHYGADVSANLSWQYMRQLCMRLPGSSQGHDPTEEQLELFEELVNRYRQVTGDVTTRIEYRWPPTLPNRILDVSVEEFCSRIRALRMALGRITESPASLLYASATKASITLEIHGMQRWLDELESRWRRAETPLWSDAQSFNTAWTMSRAGRVAEGERGVRVFGPHLVSGMYSSTCNFDIASDMFRGFLDLIPEPQQLTDTVRIVLGLEENEALDRRSTKVIALYGRMLSEARPFSSSDLAFDEDFDEEEAGERLGFGKATKDALYKAALEFDLERRET